ncbi:MAG: cytochrome c, partial [Phyllobacteriaceae bacterium]|nr:cytochrome c [Phyllobacteriaceae bacterium]
EIARTVIKGFSYMPPFGDVLTDVQIASILTYVRTSWGNDYGLVTPEEVAANR